jgi:TfoX/Sxy family transcriptional regulator of competence genes
MTNDARLMRLRDALANRKGITEQVMFGGVCFMLRGNMLCGSGKSGFMFRVGKELEPVALARPGATRVVLGRRRMVGFVWADPEHCQGRALRAWIALAERYVGTLPAKARKKAVKRARSSTPT